MKKTFKSIGAICAMVCFHTMAFAQQDPQYSQYMFNTMAVNPAYTGSRDVVNITLLHRKQWNINGSPQSSTLAVDLPMLNEKIGVGLLVFNDQIGIISNTGVYACYAQRIRLTNAGTLSFGITAGGTQFGANAADVNTYAPGDKAFAANINSFKPNAGIGAYYATDKWYAGLSMPRLANNKLGTAEIAQQASQFRHYFLMAGFVKHINSYIVVKPSIMGKVVSGAPMQLDANLNFWFYDKFSIGASYRTGDAVLAMVELIPAQRWRLGYAYDFTLSGLQNANGKTQGSNEIMLRYEFATQSSKILSPRYF